MKTKSILAACAFLLLQTLMIESLYAQSYSTGRTVIVNGAAGKIESGEYSSSVVIGEPFVLGTKGLNNATSTGLWGLQLNSPSSPNINASEGDFSDKVVISWQLETLSPAPGKGYHVFRDGTLLARLAASDTSYTDSNVKAGNFYFYTITAINNYGESVLGNTTGFVNPNGVITGTVTTSKKRPVSDVEVALSPVAGRSLSFDGTDDKLDVASNKVSTINSLIDTAFTFSMWVNPGSTGTDRMLGGGQFQDGSGESYPFVLRTSGNQFATTINTTSGEQTLTGTTTFSTSQWYQVALTYSPSSGVNFYVNGSLEGSTTLSGAVDSLSSFVIGEDLDTTGLANWDGLVDEIRLWNIARDSSSIQGDKDRTIGGKTENLIGYWRLDEGTGNLAFDLTSQKIKLDIDGAGFSAVHSNLPASAITDTLGNYQIEGIFYGSGTTFDVTPAKVAHSFVPALRNATLNASNTGINKVDFEDDSQIAVEGFVKFAGTECFEEAVEILVDGKSTIPKTFTNNKGEYTLEFEPGTSVAFGPFKNDHPFSPINYVVENINEPIAGIEFIDNDLVDLTINFVGGACKFPIGKAAVTVRTEDGCFNKEFETNNAGFAVLRNIPSNKYEVILKPENPNITFDGVQVDLSAGSDTVEFIYKAPLEAEVELLTNARRANGIPVLKMAAEGQDTTRFRMILREEYKNSTSGVLNYCYLDSGSVKINDKIALNESERTISFKNPDVTKKDSMPTYKMIVGRPNFLAGGENPYQKELQITVKDTDKREATGQFWAYIEGHQTVGNTFITTAPNRPLFILRDPPGDKSYSEITKEYTLTYKNSFGAKFEKEQEFEDVAYGGIDEYEGEGILIESLEQEREEDQVGAKESYGLGFTGRKTITFSETFKTDESTESAGGDYDIIAGAAENFLYGVVRSLTVNSDGSVEIDKKLGLETKGFQTFYYYTVQYIEEVLIPNLKEAGKDDEVENWEEHLSFHNQLTSQNFTGLLNLPQNLPQLLFKNNVSFSAGAPYIAESQYQSVTGVTWTSEVSIINDVSDELVVNIAGEGSDFKTQIKTTMSKYGESEFEFESSTSTKIVLDDATEGDAFSVNIETDVLGFPLYKLKGGQSTNPWEEKTSKRDKVSLTMDSYQAVNVPPTGEAKFTLNIGNESETDEERVYEVRLIPESNPDGAIIKLGGNTLPDLNSFTIPAGETEQALITIERGPEAFEYDSLMLMAYAPGQYDLWLSTENRELLNAVDTVFFNVQFSVSCGSDVAIANFNNFVINRFDTTAYPVQAFGYNPNDPDFDQLWLEYQTVGEDFWIIADSIKADSIGNQPFVFMPWQFKDLQDGNYNLRVKSFCLDGAESSSNIITGVVDRSNPTILGEPTPVNNGFLGFNEQISVTFTEPIDTTTLFVDQIRLFNTEEDIEIPMRYSSDGFTVILTPEEQNRFIEGVRLRAEIDTLADVHGNWISEPIKWEFEVDRNPIRWNQGTLTETVYTNQSTNYSIPLNNLSPQTTSFTLTDIPSWITADPVEGEIGANGKIDITLTVKDDINFGRYSDTLNVNTTEGDEPLKLNIRALQRPPNWSVDPLNYEYQMSIIGEVILRDTVSSDPYDIVGAFVNGECRGLASPQLIGETGAFRLFFNIYSDQQQGEEITFRLWDAEDAEEYWELNDRFTFSSNTVQGAVANPVQFVSEGDLAQHITLNKGWTWITEHLLLDDQENINRIFSGSSFSEGDRVISQTQFESWSPSASRWVPGKLSFTPSEAYHVHADSSVSVTFVGQEVDPAELSFTIKPGNNWLAYPIRKNLNINTALADLSLDEGSVIRNQTQFAEYAGGEIDAWVGSLTTLRSGDGFILNSTSSDTVTFSYNTEEISGKGKARSKVAEPAYQTTDHSIIRLEIKRASIQDMERAGLRASINKSDSLNIAKETWELNVFEKQYNMPVVLALADTDPDSTWYAGAFLNGEVVGIGQFSPVEAIGDYRAMFMIYSDKAVSDEQIRFNIFNSADQTMLTTDLQAEFNASQPYGSIQTPKLVKWTKPEDIPETFALSQNYPNPFNPSTTFNFSLPEPGAVSIKIYNIIGQQVAVLVNETRKAGSYRIRWDADKSGVASGMYIAEMRAGDFRQIRKLTLIK